MYIWIAIDVDDQLSSIRKEAKRIEDMVQFAESDITLPMHISLKISCSIPNEKYEEALCDIKAILQDTQRFEIKTKRIELHDTIAWIQMEHNEYLEQLHHSLDKLFIDKYDVPPHKFDLDFKFHTTLFLDSDKDKVKQAFLMIKDVSLPSTLIADKFVIGTSPEGKIGTYQVREEIKSNTIRIVPNGPKYLESTDAYARDAENTKYMMFLPNESKEETLTFLKNAQREWQKDKPVVFEYAILLDDVHIGAVSFDFLNEERTEVEMGWIVNKRYWGHGYATEAAKIMMDFCVHELGIKKFIAHCDAENIGSYRTMEKLGMKRVSVSDGRKNRGSDEARREYRYELEIDS